MNPACLADFASNTSLEESFGGEKEVFGVEGSFFSTREFFFLRNRRCRSQKIGFLIKTSQSHFAEDYIVLLSVFFL